MIAVVTLLVTLLVGCVGYLLYSRYGTPSAAAVPAKPTGTFRPTGRTITEAVDLGNASDSPSASDDSEDGEEEEANEEGQTGGAKGGRRNKKKKEAKEGGSSSVNRLLKKKQEKQKEKEARAQALAASIEDRRREKEEQAEREKKLVADAEAAEEAEESALRELRAAKKQQEDEEYAKWTSHIGVVDKGELGSKADHDRAIDAFFTKQYQSVEQGDTTVSRVIVLDAAARQHQTDVDKIVARLETLVQLNAISGVFDDRGKFLFVTSSQYQSIARFLKSRGRVSFSQLIREANKLVTEGLEVEQS